MYYFDYIKFRNLAASSSDNNSSFFLSYSPKGTCISLEKIIRFCISKNDFISSCSIVTYYFIQFFSVLKTGVTIFIHLLPCIRCTCNRWISFWTSSKHGLFSKSSYTCCTNLAIFWFIWLK